MILDTNALSGWWGNDPGLVRIMAVQTQICVPVPALAEFRFGVLQSTKRDAMRKWMTEALTSIAILPVNDETTHHYAVIRLELKRVGRPIPMNDLWIAAIARQHRLVLLSRDAHFDFVEHLQRVSW